MGTAVHWNEQAHTLVKAWTDAHKQMWESWSGLMQAGSTPFATPFDRRLVDQWRELATQTLQAWSAESEQITKDVGGRLLAGQREMMRFLNISLTAWMTIAPRLEAGEDWQSTLHRYTETLRQQFLLLPTEMDRIAQDVGELAQLYLTEWQKLFQPWLESLRQAPSHFGEESTGHGTALIEWTNLYWDAYERTFGRLVESPSLGHTRELNEDLLKGFDAWLDYRRASFEYHVAVADAWTRAFEQFIRRLVALADQGQPVQSVRQLMFVWIEVIDQVFAELFRTEKYIRIQGRLVNTATAYRLRERELVEGFLKTTHIPTRSELDEAYRRIYQLNKDTKELKKTVQDLKAELAEAANVREAFQNFKKALQEIRAELPSARASLPEKGP